MDGGVCGHGGKLTGGLQWAKVALKAIEQVEKMDGEVYSCYTVSHMRKWLAILLLVFMPLQLSWAAAASYCQHESGTAAKHFGHHDHQHKTADGKDASSDPAKTTGGDPDCASCHAGCSSALPRAVTISALADSSLGAADYWARLTSPPFERLERPQWCVLA